MSYLTQVERYTQSLGEPRKLRTPVEAVTSLQLSRPPALRLDPFLELPEGVRMPYEVHLCGYRIRNMSVILFVRTLREDGTREDVARSDKIRVEYSDLLLPEDATQLAESNPKSRKLIRFQRLKALWESGCAAQEARLVNTPDAEKIAQTHLEQTGYTGSYITSAALVWDDAPVPDAPQEFRLCWRIEFFWQLKYYVLTIFPDGVGKWHFAEPRVQSAFNPLPRSALTLLDGVFGSGKHSHIRYGVRGSTENLQFTFRREMSNRVAGLWSSWNELAKLITWLEYHEFAPPANLHRVTINLHDPQHFNLPGSDQLALQQSGACVTCMEGGGVMLSFLVEEAVNWALDSSVVLHELGHVLWLSTFARPPELLMEARTPETIELLKGIEEGFCDYLAASILNEDAEEPTGQVYLGKVIDQVLAPRNPPQNGTNGNGANGVHAFRSAAALRIVSGDAITPMQGAPLRYEICRQWANLLWDMRGRFRVAAGKAEQSDVLKTINKVILEAHLMPTTLPETFTTPEPLGCYLDVLRRCAERRALPPIDWIGLANKHGIVLPS
jgi:hypothetical protein